MSIKMATFLEWVKNTLANASREDRHSRRSGPNTFPRVYDSQLEDRRVLNAGAVISAMDLATLSFDAGSAANDGGTDKFELTRIDSARGSNRIEVSINNQLVWQGDADSLQTIRFNGSSDADQFYIDPTIQLPSGIYVNGTGVANLPQTTGSVDVVVFATASGTRFDQITYQTTDNLTQIRFASPVQSLSSVVQVENVDSIRDLTTASGRTIETGVQSDSYSLQNTTGSGLTDEDRNVRFLSSSGQIDFAVPSDRLTINLRSTPVSSNTLLIESVDLSGTEHFEVLGESKDVVRQNGQLTIGRTLTIEAGTIDVDGSISTGLGGEVRLDAGSGILTVNGQISSLGDDLHRGGKVSLLGDQVLLLDRTRVDVSGGTGGGQLLVGGGYQGKDTSVRNSRYTFVARDAVLNADARIRGNGGSIIVWSDDTSIINGSGNMAARGGVEAGDGGFIETSGKRYLKVDGAVSTYAYNGSVGTWLLDPNDIEIVTTAGAASDTSYVLVSDIVSGLANNNVTIVTNTVSAGNGDIRIVAALNLAPTVSRTLTLNATRDIVFQSGLSGNSNLNVSLISGRDVNSTSVTIGQLASLTINAARNVSVGTTNLSGGAFSATIDSDNNDNNATFQSTGPLSAGSISITGSTTNNDDVTLGSTATTSTGAIQFSQIDDLTLQDDVTAATNVTFANVSGPLSLGSNVDITANNGPINFSTVTNGVVLAGSNGSTNIITANGATGSLTLGNVTATNPTVALTLSSATSTSVGSINIQNGALSITIDSDDNTVNATFQSTGALAAGTIGITGSTTNNDDVTLGSTATTSTGAIQFSQIDDLTLQDDVSAATNVTFANVSGPLSLGSNVDITANNGPINFSTVTNGIVLAGSNGSTNIITANGATGSLTLGNVTATNPTVALTLSSATNTSVGSINIQNGALSITIDSDNNTVNATFQSTGALAAGTIGITGSTTNNDDVTLGSTATTSTGAIQFSQIDDLTLQDDVTAATNITFSNVSGPLSLGSNVDITANNGPIDFSTVTNGVVLTGSNSSTNIITASGATGSLTLGNVTATNPTVALTLSSATNTSVGSINIQNGALSITIDSDNNTVNATFQSTGALAAGTIGITGSTTNNDDVTLGSTATTSTGAIQFSQIDDLTLQDDVTAATNVTFANVSGPLSLGSNVDITANNGPINFSTVTNGVVLAGSNGSTNIITANGATGSLTLGNVTATNPTVALTLSSATNTSVGSINIQNGALSITIDSDNNTVNATFQSTGALAAGTIGITGSTTNNDDVTLGSTATTSTGAIQFSQIDDLTLQDDVTAATNITFANVSGPLSLGSNVNITANNGPIDFSTVTNGIVLAGSNGSTNIITANGATGSLTLGNVTATNPTVALTLRSATNTSVGSINIQNGALSITIDSDNNTVNATFQSTGALAAGSISITGSTTNNDDVTLGSTATTSTGAIQFSQIDDLTLQDDVTAATNVTFSNVSGPLSLGSNVDITANNGPINFSTVTNGVVLAGSNGSTNIITANGATGSLTLGNVTATNPTVALTLRSATNTSVGSINIQNGALSITIDSDNNTVNATFQSTGALAAGTIGITGSTTNNDDVTLGSTATTSTGAIQFSQIDDLTLQDDVTAATNVTFANVSGPLSLGSNVDITANNGPINFSTVTNGIVLAGSNGSTNIITANGATGSLTLGTVTATNPTVALTLRSATNTSVGSINIQNGALSITIDSDDNTVNATFQSTGALAAGTIGITGSTTNDDDVTLGSTATTSTGAIQFSQIDDLTLQDDVTAATNVTFANVSGPLSLGSNVDITANNGPIDFSTVTNGVVLAGSNGSTNIITANGVTGSLTLGNVTATNPTVALTLRSATNTSVGSINIQNGALSITIDSDNNTVNATFQSTGALAAGTISITGSTTNNDDVTLGSTATTSTGAIQFSQIDDLTLQDDVTAATNITFSNVSGPLSLGSNVDITANNGPINFSTVTNGIVLTGSNGSTNILTTNGATGSLTLGNVTATNPTVALTLSSATNTSVGSVNIQNGVLSITIDSDDNTVNATFQSTGALAAGTIGITGSTTNNDDVTLGSTATTSTGAIQFSQIDDLTLQDDVTAATNITFSNVSGPLSLGSNVDITANNGPIDFSTVTNGIVLTGSNGSTNIITASGATGSLTLGNVTATNPTVALTLRSATNTSVGSINIQNGALSITIDSDNNTVNATFQSTGALAAGTIGITGSTTNDDDATLGSTATTSTGAIQFSQIDDLTLQDDVTAATNVTFSNVTGPLSLGSNVDITANNGPIDFSTVTNGVVLAGSNGSTNIITANGAAGSLTLGNVTATNPTVTLTLRSANDVSAGDINIQNGTLDISFNSLNTTGVNIASLSAITADRLKISGNSRVDDQIKLNGAATIGSGGILIDRYNDLAINAALASTGGITTTGISGSKTHLAADVTSNGGDIAMTGGTLLIDGGTARTIASGGGGVAVGGNITLGDIDGENGVADLTVDSRGTTTGGAVSIGTVTAATSGLNRLNVRTDAATTPGQVTLSGTRLVANGSTAATLIVDSEGATILANGAIDLSSSTTTDGGSINFGLSKIAPTTASSTLILKTNNTSASGGDGGDITLGGVSNSGTNYFDSLTIDTSVANTVKTAGDLNFNGQADPSLAVDGTSGSGITLIGTILKSFTGILKFLTNPKNASQVSSSIDVTRANINVSGDLEFDTSGANNSTVAGNVLIGDVGLTTQPTSLKVDTRGTTAQGLLKLNDGDGASTTDIRVAGSIDLSRASVELNDGVLLDSNGTNADLSLGQTTTNGSPQSLQLTSDRNISLLSANLQGGSFTAAIDTDDNNSGATFQSTGAILASSVEISGSAANDDIATMNANVTTSGHVSFSNLDQLRIRGTVTAGTTFVASNIVGAVDFSGNSGITANGSIDLRTSVNSIVISSMAGNTTLIDARGNSSVVSLTNVTATNPGARLNVRSDYSVDLLTVDMNTGTLDVLIGRSTTLIDAKAQLRQVIAGGLIVTGTSTANNAVVLDGLLDIGTGGISIQNLNTLDVNFHVQSDGDIIANNIRDRIRFAQAASVQSDRGINLQLNVGQIQLTGGVVALTNLFEANGDTSSLQLASIVAIQDVILVLSSANNIDVTSVNARGSSLEIQVDSNNNTLGSRLVAGQIQVSQLSVRGGLTTNDIASLNGLVESTSGSILVDSFGTVHVNGDLIASRAIDVANIGASVNIGAGRLVKASDGNATINNNVNEIRFVGGVGTTTSIQSANGSLFAARLTETNASSMIDLRADRDVSLQSSLLNSNLQIVAGDHNSSTGTINSTATLSAASISLNAATGIGTISPIATSTINISASNRLGGVVQISNNNNGAVTVSSLVSNEGGNIGFEQTGGGTVRFQNVNSNPDGSPAANEGNISLSNTGGNLIVEGVGVSAGGLGSVSLATNNTGNIQLVAATRANAGTVGIRSAQDIAGNGIVKANFVDLDATTGIGLASAVQTETTQLSAKSQSNSVEVRNSSATLTNVSLLQSSGSGSVQFRQVGGGDVAFANITTGAASTNAGSNIGLRNDNGSVIVQGRVEAGGGGSIELNAQKNLVLSSGAVVRTNGANATISGDAGEQFLFATGATIFAGSSNANTEAVVTRIPPNVSLQALVNSAGVNVDSEGISTIQIQIDGSNPLLLDRNFSVVIDWGDGEVDVFPIGQLSAMTVNPQIARFDAGVVYQITHDYEGNPNLNDPIANIPVSVTVGIDALNRIQFRDSQGTIQGLTQVERESLVVPAAGLFSLRFDLPQVATPQARIVFNNFVFVPLDNNALSAAVSSEIIVSSGGSAVEKVRTYILRVITPLNEQGAVESSEQITLTDEDIQDLSSGKLFKRLGDNRYRIYLIREDGNELLLKDFYLRNHRPIEIEDSPLAPADFSTDEPVLDQQPSTTSSSPSLGLNAVQVEEAKLIESDRTRTSELEPETNEDEKPITNATLAIGSVAHTVRSWRKAARRFRAG